MTQDHQAQVDAVREECAGLIAGLSPYDRADALDAIDRLAALASAPPAPAIDIDAAANRLMMWRLPDDFSPDCGISFDGRKDDEWNKNKTWPAGTNLFNVEQAKKMLGYALAGASPAPAASEPVAYLWQHGGYYDNMICPGAVHVSLSDPRPFQIDEAITPIIRFEPLYAASKPPAASEPVAKNYYRPYDADDEPSPAVSSDEQDARRERIAAVDERSSLDEARASLKGEQP